MTMIDRCRPWELKQALGETTAYVDPDRVWHALRVAWGGFWWWAVSLVSLRPSS